MKKSRVFVLGAYFKRDMIYPIPFFFETKTSFSRWIDESKYVAADHQWLEEHLHFNDEFAHTGGMDLYMPIRRK